MNLFCPIRKKEVTATPEERVRASFLSFLLEKGFPKEYILVEASLSDLPHIKEKFLFDRRLDILCYSKNLEPLLLVECKSQAHPKDLSQLLGYNHYIQAPYIALVSTKVLELRCASGGVVPFNEFPTYSSFFTPSESQNLTKNGHDLR